MPAEGAGHGLVPGLADPASSYPGPRALGGYRPRGQAEPQPSRRRRCAAFHHAVAGQPGAPALLHRPGESGPGRASWLSLTEAAFQTPGRAGREGREGRAAGLGVGSDVQALLKTKTAFLKLGDCREGSGEGLEYGLPGDPLSCPGKGLRMRLLNIYGMAGIDRVGTVTWQGGQGQLPFLFSFQ